eukprot:scaffold199875_cov32-Tisochrysis_lutea.AAC.3
MCRRQVEKGREGGSKALRMFQQALYVQDTDKLWRHCAHLNVCLLAPEQQSVGKCAQPLL